MTLHRNSARAGRCEATSCAVRRLGRGGEVGSRHGTVYRCAAEEQAAATSCAVRRLSRMRSVARRGSRQPPRHATCAPPRPQPRWWARGGSAGSCHVMRRVLRRDGNAAGKQAAGAHRLDTATQRRPGATPVAGAGAHRGLLPRCGAEAAPRWWAAGEQAPGAGAHRWPRHCPDLVAKGGSG